jgi:uncharacterized membrane protein YdbT with pleckstrin-like domain
MLYAKQNLLPDEKIILFTKPHYVVLFSMLAWLIIAIWAGFHNKVLLLICIVGCIHSLINYYCSEYVITNQRIIMKVGFIRRKSIEIFLERLEGVSVEQSIVGRILNYGTVIVGGIGGTQNPFLYIPNPIGFRNTVLQTQTQVKSKV